MVAPTLKPRTFVRGFLYFHILLNSSAHGAYGVMVSTEVCGTSSSGSNPDRHPRSKIGMTTWSCQFLYLRVGEANKLLCLRLGFEDRNISRSEYEAGSRVLRSKAT